MPLISSTTLISSLSGLHLLVAYYLYTSPVTIARNSSVTLLAASMGLPISRSFMDPSGPLRLVSLMLGVVSTTDLFAANMHEETAVFYWAAQAPLRTAIFFVLSIWAYIGRPGGFKGMPGMDVFRGIGMENWQESASDGVIFSWLFFEAIMWFWIYNTARDERKDSLVAIADKRKREQQK